MVPSLGAVLATSFGVANYAVLGAYLAVLIGIGFYYGRKEKSADQYFLASRRIPWWAAGLSIFGGGLSGITFMAIPANAYAKDWVLILRQFSPILLIPLVVAFYIPFYRRLRVTTAYEYLERRFNLPVRLLASLYFIVFQFARNAIVLYIPAIALATVTGINVYWCILLMGVLATVYTTMGGIEAVVWNDVLQVIVLMGGAVLALVMVLAKVDGGMLGVIRIGAEHGKFHTFNWTWDHTVASVWVVLLGGLLGDLMPNTADQAVVQRYMITRDERSARRAAWTSALLGIPTAFLFFFLGTALWAFYQSHAADVPKDLDATAILPLFVMQQLPPGLAGLVVAGVFAASMSSIDSGLNSIATAVTTDFYRRLGKSSQQAQILRFGKLATIVCGAAATALAMVLAGMQLQFAQAAKQTSLLELFLNALVMAGGTLAGLFVLGIFTRRATGTAALVAALLSAAAVLTAKLYTQVQFFFLVLIGLGVCVGGGYLLSFLLPGRKDIEGLTIYTIRNEEET